MPNRVAINTLNARTIDIINTIRANASYEYQSQIPEIDLEDDVPKVGEALFGYPALANEFINSLVNRIALVAIKSATFNNPYADLKKGYLEFGETVEEIFTELVKAIDYSAEKADRREHKRYIPDVRTAFHVINYRAMYPITIQQDELKRAFLSANGVTELISKIIGNIYTAAEYDEFLLFKYMIIKAIASGKMLPVGVDTSDLKNAAKKFRGYANNIKFISNKYNASGVNTSTPAERQYIFMDSFFNADYDVDVLASAFNMDRASFSGKLKLIDDFSSFDNDRFNVIREASTGLEEVTDAELAITSNVKAVLVDSEWFQIYDNLAQMEDTKVSSGLYWNYFYHNWKTVSFSPFANAIVFVDDDVEETSPDSLTVEVTDKSVNEYATVITLTPDWDDNDMYSKNVEFIQTEDAVENSVAVHKYGAVMFPANASSVELQIKVNGVTYTSSSDLATTADVGDTLTFIRDDYVDDRLSALSITGVTLTPAFNKDVITYTGATTTASGTITVTAVDSTVTPVVKFNGTTVSGTTLNFSGGAGNVVTVELAGVSKGEATTKTYTITVTKS